MRGIDVTVGRTVAQVEQPEQEAPPVYTPDPDYADWTDEQVAAELEKLSTEHRRRQAMTEAAQVTERAAVAYLAAAGVHDGDAWVRPVAVGYPAGARATHDGHVWVNRVPNNFHAPGVSGWRIETTEGDPPAPFVKPVSPFDAYAYSEQVTHDGQVYESVFDLGDGLNYWSPSEMPDYWQLVGSNDGSDDDDGDPEPAPDPEPEPDGVSVWVRPEWAGEAGGAYQLGDRVHYPDQHGPVYESTHDGWNTWSPAEYGWAEVPE